MTLIIIIIIMMMMMMMMMMRVQHGPGPLILSMRKGSEVKCTWLGPERW